MRITFLGLGRMGRELVTHVIDAGHDVTVWNRSPDAAVRATERGARWAATPGMAVEGADVVVSVLFGPRAVRDVVIDGVDTFASGALWVDVSTVGPDDARRQAAWALEHEVRYVQSPVLGTLAPARAKSLGVLLGGAPTDVAAARAVTDLWADPQRVFVLASPERAAAGKLAVNLGLAVSMQGLAEALRVGASAGLAASEVLDLLEKTPLAGIAAAKGDTVLSDSYDDAQFTVNALTKDLDLVLEAAQGLPAAEAARIALSAAREAGLGDSDFSVVARVSRD